MGNYGIVNDNSNYVLEQIADGNSMCAIAKELGCGVSSVAAFLRKQGVKSKHSFTCDPNNLLKNKLDRVIKLYEEGHSTADIGRIVGHTGSAVWHLLKKHNKLVDKRYNVDETFFKQIDSEAKAYILGWIYSDGNITWKDDGKIDSRMRIQIQEEDSYILEKIAQLMQYDGPLYDVPPPKKFPHRKAQRVLCINRKVLVEQLIRLGCPPNKSLVLRFPDSDIVPDNLLHHFVRGYFDGDGSVSVRRSKYLNVGLTSTDLFLNSFREIVLDPLNISSTLHYRYKNTNSATLFVARQNDVRKFYGYMYQDASLFLTRKRKKFQECLQ